MLYTNTLPSFEIDPYTLVFYFVLFAVIYGIAICALSYFGESYMEYHDPVNVADTRSKSQKRLAARNTPNRGK